LQKYKTSRNEVTKVVFNNSRPRVVISVSIKGYMMLIGIILLFSVFEPVIQAVNDWQDKTFGKPGAHKIKK
jgi:hypothetical protein